MDEEKVLFALAGTAERSESGGLNRVKGEEWGSGGFSPERFLSHAPLRSKERLFWSSLSHAPPMLVVKIPSTSLNEENHMKFLKKSSKKKRASS